MTDEEMAEFIMPSVEIGEALRAVRGLAPEKRALFERMAELEGEIHLWQAGVGKKPTGVILCGRREIKGAR